MKRTLLNEIVSTLVAYKNCIVKGNAEWEEKHKQKLYKLNDLLPRGSGFDSGTKIDFSSTQNKLKLTTSFHHMNENGMYDGWTGHTITIVPDLLFGVTMKISGQNKNDIKDYMYETFDYCLNQEMTEDKNGKIDLIF